MNIVQCKQCSYYIEHKADSVLCRFKKDINYRVINQNTVVSCPMMKK